MRRRACRRWTAPADPAAAAGDPTAGHPRLQPHGTTNLDAALEVASGKVISQMTARHRAIEFKRFLILIDQQVPAGLDLHVICDNSSTHTTPAIGRWLGSHPRLQLDFTPTYSSWLNLVERQGPGKVAKCPSGLPSRSRDATRELPATWDRGPTQPMVRTGQISTLPGPCR